MPERFYFPDGPRRLHVVLHGKLAGHAGFREAVREVRGWGHEIQVRVTWEAGDAARYAFEAVAAEADAVVSAGGDGLLNEVLQGLCQAGLPARCALGVVPLGTANDFATGAGVPLGDPLAALRLAAAGTARLIDVGKVNDRFFLNVVSVGSTTQFTRNVPEGAKALLGPAAYALTGMALLPNLQPQSLRLAGPDWNWEGKVLVLAVGNGRLAGGGVPVTARASLDDGMLDLMLMPDSDENDWVGLFTNLLRLHLPGQSMNVIYRQLPWLEMSAVHDLPINIDGEMVSAATARFSVLPRHLWCLLPEKE